MVHRVTRTCDDRVEADDGGHVQVVGALVGPGQFPAALDRPDNDFVLLRKLRRSQPSAIQQQELLPEKTQRRANKPEKKGEKRTSYKDFAVCTIVFIMLPIRSELQHFVTCRMDTADVSNSFPELLIRGQNMKSVFTGGVTRNETSQRLTRPRMPLDSGLGRALGTRVNALVLVNSEERKSFADSMGVKLLVGSCECSVVRGIWPFRVGVHVRAWQNKL